MNNNVVPFQTKSFPQQGIWRVHAYGEVRRNQRISSEPTVDLFIVPLKSDSDSGTDLNSSKSYDYSRLQSVQMGVGQISSICVGSLLRDQKKMYRLPDYTRKRFTFNAERDFRKTIRAGTWYNKEGKPHRLIPDSYYRIPDELRNMPCLVFNAAEIKGGKDSYSGGDAIMEKTEKIVIPCWVIFQYYYATSSRLATTLINGELEIGANQIYNPDPVMTYHDEDDGYFYVRLRQRMFNTDAHTVARIASDERVTQIAKNICNSMIADHNGGKGAFPEVRLPFFGDTEIEVSGKDIKYEGGWYFLVYNIRSCTGEFYYDKLKYDRDNDNQTDGIDDPNRETAWNTPKEHISKPRPKDDGQKITNDEPPSPNIIETEIVLPPRNFLSQPTISRKLPKKLCKYRSEKAEAIIRTKGTKKDFSTGEGESGGESARLDIKTDPENETKTRKPREAATPDFDSMMEVLELIQERKSPDFDFDLISLIEDDEYEQIGFSVFPDYQDGTRIAWSFIPGNPPRRRQAMIAELVYKNAHFYLFEIERRVNALGEPSEHFHTVIIHKGLNPVEEPELEAVLSYMTKNKGVCSAEWEFETLTREKFKHGWTVESFAETLTAYFEDQIFNRNSKVSQNPERSDFRSAQSQSVSENPEIGLRKLA
jgi:hypothetical protein